MTLTETAKATKTGLLAFIATVILVGIGWGSYSYWYNNYYLPNLPKEIITPTADFGNLQPPLFPQSQVASSNYLYSLDTESGNLPQDLPSIMKVFFIPQTGSTFLAPERAKEIANKFLFSSDPQIISTTNYLFKDQTGGEITIDLNTNNFKYTRNILPESEATPSPEIQNKVMEDQGILISNFKIYLNNKGLLHDSLRNGRAKVIYNKPSQSESTQATIYIWPEDIRNETKSYSIVSPTFSTSLINAIVTKSDKEEEKYIKLNYTFWEPDLTKTATYSIKNVDKAYEELKQGLGVVVVESKNKQVSLTDIYLAYYQSETYSPYMQPVYVFKGDDFAAYVTAITPDFIAQ